MTRKELQMGVLGEMVVARDLEIFRLDQRLKAQLRLNDQQGVKIRELLNESEARKVLLERVVDHRYESISMGATSYRKEVRGQVREHLGMRPLEPQGYMVGVMSIEDQLCR